MNTFNNISGLSLNLARYLHYLRAMVARAACWAGITNFYFSIVLILGLGSLGDLTFGDDFENCATTTANITQSKPVELTSASFVYTAFQALMGSAQKFSDLKILSESAQPLAYSAKWILKEWPNLLELRQTKPYSKFARHVVDLADRWHDLLLAELLKNSIGTQKFTETLSATLDSYFVLQALRNARAELETNEIERSVGGQIFHDEFIPLVAEATILDLVRQQPDIGVAQFINDMSFSVAAGSRSEEAGTNLRLISSQAIFRNIANLAATRFEIAVDVDENLQLSNSELVGPLRASLTELVRNARKYSKQDQARNYLKIYWDKNSLFIEDRGLGIADPSKIGLSGYRAPEHKLLARGGGTGIHAMIKRLKAFGISIHIQSKVSEGSIFELRFPPELVKN